MITLFFMGTMQHREGESDILTQFYLWTKEGAGEYKTHHTRLFDGVGAQPKYANSPHPMPGTYTYDPVNNIKRKIYPSNLRRLHTTIQAITGSVAGDGVEDLLLEAMQYIEHILSQDEDSHTINLIGFSRGADTAVRLSNILNILYPDIEVNIFTIDQVPGPGNRDDRSSYTIQPNVKEFNAILMLDETTPCFSPQHKARYVFNGLDTRVKFRLYHGVHGQAMKRSSLPIPMYLAHNQLLRFAWRHQIRIFDEEEITDILGPAYPLRDKTIARITSKSHKQDQAQDREEEQEQEQEQLDDDLYRKIPILTADEQLLLYHQMLAKKNAYSEGLTINRRSFTKLRHDYVGDATFFLDNSHRQLFRQIYPCLFDWLFKQGEEGSSHAQAQSDFDALKLGDLDGFKRLTHTKKLGINKKNGEYQLPIHPVGTTSREMDEDKPIVHDELSYLQHSLYALANYHLKHRAHKLSPYVIDVIKFLLAEVQASKMSEYHDDKKITLLDCVVERAREYLHLHHPGHFMLTQLRQISPNFKKLAERMKKLFFSLMHHLKAAGQETLNYLQQIISQVDAIIRNTLSTAWDKFIHLQRTMREVCEALFDNDQHDNLLCNSPHNTLKLAKISSNLEQVVLYSGGDFATLAIKKLSAYIHKKNISLHINHITFALGITKFDQHLMDKILIAQSALGTIYQLKKAEKGNSREELSTLLSQHRLNNLRKHPDATFLNCDLDRLLSKLEIWAAILKPDSILAADYKNDDTLSPVM